MLDKKTKERQLLLADEMVRTALLGIKRSTWRPIPEQLGQKGIPSTNPYGIAGDKLYVREAWNLIKRGRRKCRTWEDSIPTKHPKGWELVYRADQGSYFTGPWKPSIFMPRWASRVLYRIRSISPRRLQSITLKEIWLDGIRIPATKRDDGKTTPFIRITGKYPPVDYVDKLFTRWTEKELFQAHFASAWDSMYFKRGYAWSTNPWCWYIRLEKLEGSKTDFPNQKFMGFC